MPQYSTFTPYGMLKFSVNPSSGQVMYDNLRESQGGDDGPFRETGYQGAKLYAQAMGLARIKELYDRVKEQHSPDTVTFLLEQMELQHGIIPDTSRTDAQRRQRLATRMAGASALEDRLRAGLTQILGASFVDIIMTDDPVFLDLVNNFPATPPTEANFRQPGAIAKWGVVQTNRGIGDTTFFYTSLFPGDGSDPNEAFKAGETIVFGSHNATLLQKNVVSFTFLSAFDPVLQKFKWGVTLASPLTKVIEVGQGFTSANYPYFPTGRRRILVKVAASVALDARLVADVNDFMRHNVRISTSWDLNTPQTPGFKIGESLLGFETFTDDP